MMFHIRNFQTVFKIKIDDLRTNKSWLCSTAAQNIKINFDDGHPGDNKREFFKLMGQEYFGVIIQNSIIFFLVSMEAKNQLDTSYPLWVF